MSDESPPAVESPDTASSGSFLTDSELDAIEDDLVRAERTLGLLADDEVDPAAVAGWLDDPPAEPHDDGAGAATRS